MTPHLIPPSIFLQDSLFHSNVVYVNNGWNCVNIASFKLGHADQVYDNDCIITNQERVDDLFGEYFLGNGSDGPLPSWMTLFQPPHILYPPLYLHALTIPPYPLHTLLFPPLPSPHFSFSHNTQRTATNLGQIKQ